MKLIIVVTTTSILLQIGTVAGFEISSFVVRPRTDFTYNEIVQSYYTCSAVFISL
jgi:hypothetical protein